MSHWIFKIFLAFSIPVLCLLHFARPAIAGELFNPSPTNIEAPSDDPAVVCKRLMTSSDGKTPVVKNLEPAWINTLADRGKPTIYTKANSQNFAFIGMPVGGIGAGEIYLSGDGQLWDWDIFGTRCLPGSPLESGAFYAAPHKVRDSQDSSQQIIDQGFCIRIQQGNRKDTRMLDKSGFSDISFSGQYPIGSVDYSDPTSPVRVHLEAFSPFIPSDVEDSSYPATILNYTVENTSREQVKCSLGAWMENAVGTAAHTQGLLKNVASIHQGYTTLDFGMKEIPADGMALAMMGGDVNVAAQVAGSKSSEDCLDAPAMDFADLKVEGVRSKLIGALRRTRTLAPGEKITFSFIISWYFPDSLNLGLSTPTTRLYSVRFKSAQDVVDHIVANFDRLANDTRAWRDCWYDSTLPYYFLDRTFLNISTLATSTSYLLGDGRFYGYEGRYSCPGTCTHVWGYQQALGYLFPDLEKAIMEKVEFVSGLGMNGDGGITMRAEYSKVPVVDGQSGVILRTYLAHRMSADDSFLQRNYKSVKKATDFLVHQYDPNQQGILEGSQSNTMDAAWYGKIPWLSLYYQTALRATAEMADIENDSAYAHSLRTIADKGHTYLETQLFNGEYFFQQPDPTHPDSPGTFNGCPIEQVMGQNWAYEVGLGDIIDREKVLTTLNSIWKYNYTTDVGPYRKVFSAGLNYAMPGEGGLIMCTLPYGGKIPTWKDASFYNSESWSGSEYELSALMMWDGMVDKALAEIKTLQARYDGAKRNPWNEVECGSHYSRAMASYGVFVAASGFEYDGPKATMAFAPRMNPNDFKAAFTSADGWGSFSQKYDGKGMEASVTLRYGKLRLKTLSLVLPRAGAQGAEAQVDGKKQLVSLRSTGNRIVLSFSSDIIIKTGQTLKIIINP